MNSIIKYFDLHQFNNSFEPTLSAELLRVTRSGWYLQGEATANFERAFAAYCGTSYCIGTGNGLDAITLIFLGYQELGLMQEGDEVIVPANTFIATLLGVMRAGLRPVLCEPCPDTCNIDPSLVERLITPRTRALLAVHLYGRLADMEALRSIADKHGLMLVEDAAQAHGAQLTDNSSKGSRQDTDKAPLLRAGGLADAAAFSFYPAKNLGALGDGGAVTTSDSKLASLVRSLGNYGSKEKYIHRYRGVNSRLDELQAAALSVKLPRLDDDNARRRAIVEKYLKGINWERTGLRTTCPHLLPDESNVYHIFPIFSAEREELCQRLTEQGIHTQIHYPIPPHRQQALRATYGSLHLPITERIHREELSLPISPLLTDEEVERIISAINETATRK